MGDAIVGALGSLADPGLLVMLMAGVLAGLVIGMIPGLGGTAAVALLLPVIYTVGPTEALALMTGALAVVHTSDTITAVLLGAPGSASSAVTMLDGHQLARQGQAARALSAGFLSSMIGGLLGAVGLTLSIVVARPLVLAFGSPELFMLCVLGVALAAFLSEGSMLKGMVAGAFGVLLGTVGAAPTVPEYRFTFGQLFLYEGLPLVAVALGIFGIVEIANLVAKRGAVAERIPVSGGWAQGARDVAKHWTLVLRGSLIGMWAGVLPAIGATAGTWMAYGQTVATSKDKRKFGKGDIRGVIGPEGANNSVEAGDLIPTLLFGIPGGVPAALLMSALLFYGIQPGPRVVTDHLDLVYLIVWTFAIANVIGAALCFLASPTLARLTSIPFTTLAPALVLLMFVGTYQEHNQMSDLLIMVLLGILAWFMKEAGFSRAPLLIGFVLSLPLERYYWLSINLHGPSFLIRPIVLVLIGVLVLSIAWAVISYRRSRHPEPSEADDKPAPVKWRLGLGAAFLVLFAGATASALVMEPEARLMPLLAGATGLILSIVSVGLDWAALRKSTSEEHDRVVDLTPLRTFIGLALAVVVIWAFGFAAALLVLVPLSLKLLTKLSLVRIGAYTVISFAAFYGIAVILKISWPTGVMVS